MTNDETMNKLLTSLEKAVDMLERMEQENPKSSDMTDLMLYKKMHSLMQNHFGRVKAPSESFKIRIPKSRKITLPEEPLELLGIKYNKDIVEITIKKAEHHATSRIETPFGALDIGWNTTNFRLSESDATPSYEIHIPSDEGTGKPLPTRDTTTSEE